jgi:hypothetical protein
LKAKTIDMGNLLADVEFNNRFTGIPGQRAEGGVTGPYESHSGGSGGGAEGGCGPILLLKILFVEVV